MTVFEKILPYLSEDAKKYFGNYTYQHSDINLGIIAKVKSGAEIPTERYECLAKSFNDAVERGIVTAVTYPPQQEYLMELSQKEHLDYWVIKIYIDTPLDVKTLNNILDQKVN